MPNTKRFSKELIDKLLGKGITPSELRLALFILNSTVLESSGDWTEPITVKEMAKQLNGIAMSTVSTAIDKLRKKGLIETERVGNGPNKYRVCIPGRGAFSDSGPPRIRRGRKRNIEMGT